jgi:hypothetical protein
MPKYVIERDVPGIGNATDEEVQAISQKSCSVCCWVSGTTTAEVEGWPVFGLL